MEKNKKTMSLNRVPYRRLLYVRQDEIHSPVRVICGFSNWMSFSGGKECPECPCGRCDREIGLVWSARGTVSFGRPPTTARSALSIIAARVPSPFATELDQRTRRQTVRLRAQWSVIENGTGKRGEPVQSNTFCEFCARRRGTSIGSGSGRAGRQARRLLQAATRSSCSHQPYYALRAPAYRSYPWQRSLPPQPRCAGCRQDRLRTQIRTEFSTGKDWL